MLTKERKELMMQVVDDDLTVIPIMHQLSRYVHCDKFLKWLIANRITGKDLRYWLTFQHANSVMTMVQFIIMKVNREKVFRPVLLGKDWN